MQKLLSLLIVVLLMALPVCAEETAPAEEGGWLDAETGDAQAQVYMLQGVILEAQEGGWLIEDAAQGEVLVLVSDETVMETGYELAVGDYVYVDYDGTMTRSLPPQVTAGRIVSHKLEGDVLETYPAENALLLYATDGNEYRVNLPEEWAETGFDAQRAIVYYDGAATLSIPPQVSAGLVKVENGEVLILVDSAERPEEIDLNRARREADAAKEAMLQKRSIQEYRMAQFTLARAAARMKVKGRHGGFQG